MKETILAIDDHEDALYALERILVHNGYKVIAASSGEEAIALAKSHIPDLILLDVMMPQMDGYQVTRIMKSDEVLRYVPLILVTAKGTLNDIVTGLNEGADGYLTKPFQPEELLARVQSALRLRRLYEELRTSKEKNKHLEALLNTRYDTKNIIGDSSAMKQVFSLIEKVSAAENPVLITGPSGTGKELAARAIHFNSPRKNKPFIVKNCAAFSEQLIESELFGHTKGAFTGAHKDTSGLLVAANGGTLFLDEIGEMQSQLQAKLLRVVQEGTFLPVGSTEEKKVDVRFVTATNRNLLEMVEAGTFREDLYYRLNVINIDLPPLSKRREDIPKLIEHFLKQIAIEKGSKPHSISKRALDVLTAHTWRGNVRELENEIERMIILTDEDSELDINVISPHILTSNNENKNETPSRGTLKDAVEDLERQMILETLQNTGWNKSTAAKELGISRSNLISKVQSYGLEN